MCDALEVQAGQGGGPGGEGSLGLGIQSEDLLDPIQHLRKRLVGFAAAAGFSLIIRSAFSCLVAAPSAGLQVKPWCPFLV